MKSLNEKIYNQGWPPVGRQVRNQVGGPVCVYAWEQVDWRVESQVWWQVREPVRLQAEEQVGGQIWRKVYEKLN